MKYPFENLRDRIVALKKERKSIRKGLLHNF